MLLNLEQKEVLISKIILKSMFDKNPLNTYKYKKEYLDTLDDINLIEISTNLDNRKKYMYNILPVFESEYAISAITALSDEDIAILSYKVDRERSREEFCISNNIPYYFSRELAREFEQLIASTKEYEENISDLEAFNGCDTMPAVDCKTILELLLPKTNN